MGKKIFTIPVGHLSEEDVREYVKEVAEKFKKQSNEYFIPATNYLQVVPNSHSYGNLENFIVTSQLQLQFPDEFEKEYILTGLINTLKNGYELRFNKMTMKNPPLIYFKSIQSMISYITHSDFDKDTFIQLIEATIDNGYNLKSERTMERKEVYENVDIERDYQEIMVANRNVEDDKTPDVEKPVAEWINYIEYHLEKAKSNVYHLNKSAALAEIRKVTALGIRTMEIHGCPKRIMPEE